MNIIGTKIQVIVVTAAITLGIFMVLVKPTNAMTITWNVEKCYNRHPLISRSVNVQHTCVYYVQKMMKCGHYRPGDLDGVYGAKSEAAVRHFQRDQHIAVDGIVGQQTWSHMKSTYYKTGLCPNL